MSRIVHAATRAKTFGRGACSLVQRSSNSNTLHSTIGQRHSISTFSSQNKNKTKSLIYPLKWSIPVIIGGLSLLSYTTETNEVEDEVVRYPYLSSDKERAVLVSQPPFIIGGGGGMLATSAAVRDKEKIGTSEELEMESSGDQPEANESDESPPAETIINDTEPMTESNFNDAMFLDDDDDKEEDYSDLPEDDDDTHCVICLINRQGPCRDPWRRFEKCMKESSDDNDDEKSNVVELCGKVSFKWIKCIDNHRQTYAQITNKFYEPEINATEDAVKLSKDPFPSSLSPLLDLGHWYQYLDHATDRLSEDHDENDPSEGSNYVIEEKETTPEVFLAGYAKFQIEDKDNGTIVDLAYVRDQDGNLLGFDHFSREKREDKKDGELIFNLRPNTTTVNIFALYRTPMQLGSDDKKEEDGGTSGDQAESTTGQQEIVVPKVIKEKLYMVQTSVLREADRQEAVEHDP